MKLYERALSLQEETIRHRRYFHEHAETGTELPLACAYVRQELEKLGIAARDCGCGVSAVIGSGSPCILLRADMDALSMREESGLPFASRNPKAAHTCGHDLHAAMLLTAAKLLKESESTLHGTVKLMFQPGEESLNGAKNMVTHGILTAPEPDAALAVHVGPEGEIGECWYNADSVMMLSCDAFSITLRGKGGHSAYPHKTEDPIGAAVQIYTTLTHLRTYEANPEYRTLLTIGSLTAGSAYNIIPERAILQGSLRTEDAAERVRLLRRIHEIAYNIAEVNRCRAEVTLLAENPALCCDATFTAEVLASLSSLPCKGLHPGIRSSGSDDFAQISSRIPAAYFFLSAGFPQETAYNSHHPSVRFNEAVLPFGAAFLAESAMAWLAGHSSR